MMAASKTRNQPEQRLHMAVADYLRMALGGGAIWCHVPNGGARSPTEGGIFKAMGVRAGWPDIQIVYQGRLYLIELKAQGGTLSPAQRGCQHDLLAAGATVAEARSVPMVEMFLREWGIPLKATTLGGPVLPALGGRR